MSTLLIGVCFIGLLVVGGGLGIGLLFMMQAGQRDSVSTAREGWIQRRSEKDEEGW